MMRNVLMGLAVVGITGVLFCGQIQAAETG